jgi:hypothetical protein
MRSTSLLPWIAGLAILATAASAQVPGGDMERTRFVASVQGVASIAVNPAGLAVRPDDDGVLVRYAVTDTQKVDRETNALFSLGNIGVSYRRLEANRPLRPGEERVYRMALAAGGSFVALGNTIKMIERDDSIGTRRTYDLDAGIILHPAPFLAVGAVGEDLAESEREPGVPTVRSFRAGAALLLFGRRLVLEGELWGWEGIDIEKQATARAGVAVKPTELLTLSAGYERPPDARRETGWASVGVDVSGVGFSAGVSKQREADPVRVWGEFRLALQTVRF